MDWLHEARTAVHEADTGGLWTEVASRTSDISVRQVRAPASIATRQPQSGSCGRSPKLSTAPQFWNVMHVWSKRRSFLRAIWRIDTLQDWQLVPPPRHQARRTCSCSTLALRCSCTSALFTVARPTGGC